MSLITYLLLGVGYAGFCLMFKSEREVAKKMVEEHSIEFAAWALVAIVLFWPIFALAVTAKYVVKLVVEKQ